MVDGLDKIFMLANRIPLGRHFAEVVALRLGMGRLTESDAMIYIHFGHRASFGPMVGRAQGLSSLQAALIVEDLKARIPLRKIDEKMNELIPIFRAIPPLLVFGTFIHQILVPDPGSEPDIDAFVGPLAFRILPTLSKRLGAIDLNAGETVFSMTAPRISPQALRLLQRRRTLD
jgi:hypothetical protein